MSTLFGVDTASAPSAATARNLIANNGVRWFGAYMRGINVAQAAKSWTPAVHATYRSFTQLLPIYVGQNDCGEGVGCDYSKMGGPQGFMDGVEAAALARDYGYPAGHPVALDVEYGTYERHASSCLPYVRQWIDAINRAGFHPVVYGTIALCRALGGYGGAGYWLANWIDSVPNLDNIPGTWAGRGWQYNAHWAGFDANVADGLWWKSVKGADVIDPATLAGVVRADGSRYFNETGFALRSGFRAYWEHFGGLPNFGYPRSREFKDPSTGFVTQICQKAVFEWHPDDKHPERFNVECRNLGDLMLATGSPQRADPGAFAKESA